jgi:DNA-binding transcriptional LysR family regulator
MSTSEIPGSTSQYVEHFFQFNRMNSMDFNLLKALEALLDECNVTRAAKRLGVTQPAMSGMLVRLRAHFQDALFVRAQRGIVPTRRAEELSSEIRKIIAQINALQQQTSFTPASANLTFTIAATDYALRTIAVPLLSAIRQQAPHVRISLVTVDEAQIQRQLERGEIDLALMTPNTAHPDLHARHLFEEHYVCVLRENHPVLKNRQKLTLDRFCALDHALVSFQGSAFSGITDRVLEQTGKSRKVCVSVGSFLVLPDILRSSDLVAVLPSRLVDGQQGLVAMPVPVEIPGFTKVAVWHERMHQDPAQRWMRETLFRQFPIPDKNDWRA